MKYMELIQTNHNVKVGDTCPPFEPNIVEDTVLTIAGEPVGFYLADMDKYSPKATKLASLANAEFRSERVPKSTMDRKRPISGGGYLVVSQFSTILGYVPPKPHMRRNYPTMSSVHNAKSANTFIKAMLMLCHEGEEIVKAITPNIFYRQIEIIEKKVPEKWRFGRMFTSSISNYNISAPFHRDTANLEGCVNIIIAKKFGAKGGHTTVPDYSATVNSCDNSMLVYPAYANVHGVTPIQPIDENGYRNSLVFYPLKVK